MPNEPRTQKLGIERIDPRESNRAPMRSELDENSEDERKKALAASQQQAAFVDVQSMDDEVERVLSHRCAPHALRREPYPWSREQPQSKR